MSQFSALEREEFLANVENNIYDVLIIGGGITGCGLALDSVTRGFNTLLVEMQDFASGTSSRSTKLVHGGLRYLKQFEVKMVSEVGKERAIVYENAPHVTTPEWMLLPIYKEGTFGKFSTSLGLRVYDFLAGVKKSERRKMLGVEETLKKEPLLKTKDLLGSGYYVEYRTDDARLTIEVAKKAVEKGAELFNYVKAESFIYENGKISGAILKDQETSKEYTVRAKKVINATGPWVDSLREKDGSRKGKRLQLTKGVHIVLDQSVFPLKQAVYFDTPDGRMVFAIPRDGKTYVGTTDTVYQEQLENPPITREDEQYIIDSIHFMFPDVNVNIDDIESSWAGIRPLIYEEGKGPSEISRKDEIWISESGLITIAGGKLTGYRKMAESVIDMVSKQLEQETGQKSVPGQTKYMRLSGGEFRSPEEYKQYTIEKKAELSSLGFSEKDAHHLAAFYGTNAGYLIEIANRIKNQNKLPLTVEVPLLYAIHHEMAVRPADFFIRRTGALLFDFDWVEKWKSPVIDYMKEHLGWSIEQTERYIRELELRIEDLNN